jgi:hypothetical protein
MAAQLVLSQIHTAWWHWLSTEDQLLKCCVLGPETAFMFMQDK